MPISSCQALSETGWWKISNCGNATEKRAEQLCVHDRVLFSGKFISDSDLPHVFSAADVTAFPYTERYYSASGALHLALGALKPVVVSRSPKFEEVATKISRDLN